MRSDNGAPDGRSRGAGGRLIAAALGMAAAVLAQALLHRVGLDFTGALLIAIAVLLGGWLLNAQARVPGLPLTVAGIMALTVLLTGLIDSATTAISGGTVFVALMLSAFARSWGVGLAVAVILAAAQLIAALL
ncbi:MAG: hypothetical protein JSV95_00915 [Gemmatimonadota bacterium]|nr:MAG: hypothetical protein JSV95_00915 [Gemmatimonadota bacterium]